MVAPRRLPKPKTQPMKPSRPQNVGNDNQGNAARVQLTRTQKGLIAGDKKVVQRKTKQYRTNHAGTTRAEAQTALTARMGRVTAARKAANNPPPKAAKPTVKPMRPLPPIHNPSNPFPPSRPAKTTDIRPGKANEQPLRAATTFSGMDKYKPSGPGKRNPITPPVAGKVAK